MDIDFPAKLALLQIDAHYRDKVALMYGSFALFAVSSKAPICHFCQPSKRPLRRRGGMSRCLRARCFVWCLSRKSLVYLSIRFIFNFRTRRRIHPDCNDLRLTRS